MLVDDFDYNLPPELIAQHPLEKRDISKMMVLDRTHQSISHKQFYDIADYLTPDDLLVINNTRVIAARIFGHKETGAKIEIFLLKTVDKGVWQCLLRPQKRIRPGSQIIINNDVSVKVIDLDQEDKWLIETPTNFEDLLNQVGNVPLPPYIKREQKPGSSQEDIERYQTVYASIPGAVAAPTAGLHFSHEIINQLSKKGIKRAEITLHVGLGTFKPLVCKYVKDHYMHSEYYEINEQSAELIQRYQTEKKRIIAVGTTSIRTLETIAGIHNGNIVATSGWSDIFIHPGYQFKVVDGCLTNFHLPKSTLIMLVSAFAGKDFIFKAYEEAIKNNYRFFSYGDCMLII